MGGDLLGSVATGWSFAVFARFAVLSTSALSLLAHLLSELNGYFLPVY